MSKLLVSVVVPSRGGAARLPVLLDALLRQETTVPWEVVVVLDGDMDGSRSVLDYHAEHLPLKIVEFVTNKGRSAALNAGFAHSEGNVLIRCDDDLVPDAHYVTRHAAHHQGAPVGIVGLYQNVFPPTRYARVYGQRWDVQFRREAYAVPQDMAWRYWAGNCSVTRDTWERIGPYDTNFRAYGYEDVDWGYRLSLASVPVVLDPELETQHRIAATTTASRAQRAYYSGSARARFEGKHHVASHPDPPTSAWDRAVNQLAGRLDEKSAQQLGGIIDRAAAVLPPAIARKAVALAIQSSSRSGHASGAAGQAI